MLTFSLLFFFVKSIFKAAEAVGLVSQCLREPSDGFLVLKGNWDILTRKEEAGKWR